MPNLNICFKLGATKQIVSTSILAILTSENFSGLNVPKRINQKSCFYTQMHMQPSFVQILLDKSTFFPVCGVGWTKSFTADTV